MKVLIATEKPFAAVAVNGIKCIIDKAGYEAVLLEKYASKADLLNAVADVDAIIIRSDKIDKEVIDAAKNLKIVVRAGAGFDNVDLESAKERGIVVMNTPGQNSNAVAELAIGMMIFMARGCFSPGTGTEIKGKRLGIHAYGNVGRIVAHYGKAFGMKVYAFDPFITSSAVFEADDIIQLNSVEELYSNSDYVSVHIPATAQTKGSLNYELLSKLPKGATIINTARKEVVNETELVKLFEERTDLKYATDIIADNFAEMSDKFGKRVFATAKKMGAETSEANINAGLAAANQIVAYFVSGDTKFQVNK